MDGDDAAPQWRRLCRYVSEVAVTVGVGPEACCCNPDNPANAYIAVDHRLPRYPERDVALVWDEENGWALAVETGCGEDLLVLRYLGGEILPASDVVAGFLTSALKGRSSGLPEPPALERSGSVERQFTTPLERYALPQAHPIG